MMRTRLVDAVYRNDVICLARILRKCRFNQFQRDVVNTVLKIVSYRQVEIYPDPII